MTEQEIFDTVLVHLRKQGHAAADAGKCRYRASNGDTCAAGCLIRDEEYMPEMEDVEFGGRAWKLNIKDPVWPARLMGHSPLIRALQAAHDSQLEEEGMSAWELRMRDIAEIFDLNYTKAQS